MRVPQGIQMIPIPHLSPFPYSEAYKNNKPDRFGSFSNYSVAQTLIGSLRSKAEPWLSFVDAYKQDRVIALQPTTHFSYIKEANKVLSLKSS